MDLFMDTDKRGNLLGIRRMRNTWARKLSPDKNALRIAEMRFCKQVAKMLPDTYSLEYHFNSGGPAVMGETMIYVRWTCYGDSDTVVIPVVEAQLSDHFSYMRQWDGRNSGRNIGFDWQNKQAVDYFVGMVRTLASQPFQRF